MSNTVSDNRTLAIACGGTGGHFFPGLTIAREFKRRGGHPILFVAGHHIDEHLDHARKNEIVAVPTKAIRLPANKLMLPYFAIQFLHALNFNLGLIRRHRIDIALGMGSFASAPLAIASLLARRPLLLHEGNAVVGKTNRWLAKWSRTLMLSFQLSEHCDVPGKHAVVGMPVRDTIQKIAKNPLPDVDRAQLCREHGLSPEIPIVLVFGGSQGAARINLLIKNTVEELSRELTGFQIIHLTGQNDNSEFVSLYNSKGVDCFVKRYSEDIGKLFLIANLVVCRAGASTIFELALLGLPAVLIPLPWAADNHQFENAAIVVSQNAGLLLEEKDCTVEHFTKIIEKLHNDAKSIRAMGDRIRTLAKPQATGDIVDIIFNTI